MHPIEPPAVDSDVTGTTDGRRQQDRSRRTREKILTAAVSVLVDHGYAGASTVQIQKSAGVSRGRLLHHFPSRQKLLSAAVQHLAIERIRRLETVTEIPVGAVERIRTAIDVMWSNYSQPVFWASTELWTAARTDPELRAELRPVEHRLGQVIRDSTDALFGPELSARQGYRQLRDILVSSMRGAALAYAFDPRDPATDRHLEQWRGMAEEVLVRRAQPAAPPTQPAAPPTQPAAPPTQPAAPLTPPRSDVGSIRPAP